MIYFGRNNWNKTKKTNERAAEKRRETEKGSRTEENGNKNMKSIIKSE